MKTSRFVVLCAVLTSVTYWASADTGMSLFRGESGPQGAQGARGATGAAGTATMTSLLLAANTEPTTSLTLAHTSGGAALKMTGTFNLTGADSVMLPLRHRANSNPGGNASAATTCEDGEVVVDAWCQGSNGFLVVWSCITDNPAGGGNCVGGSSGSSFPAGEGTVNAAFRYFVCQGEAGATGAGTTTAHVTCLPKAP